MISNIFLTLALAGSEWVLYLLILVSVLSVAVMFERSQFYRNSNRSIKEFQDALRKAAHFGEWDKAHQLAKERLDLAKTGAGSFEANVAFSMIEFSQSQKTALNIEALEQTGKDALLRVKNKWEDNLYILATIGNNAPFLGLFGTVLGIIQAFHSLSEQAETGAKMITSGLSEALVATAVGILVAIPAVIAFNRFQRRVRVAITDGEAFMSYLIARLSQKREG